jgi:hypothetical protein
MSHASDPHPAFLHLHARTSYADHGVDEPDQHARGAAL